MNWEKLLEKSAYWSKWFLCGYCLVHTFSTLHEQGTIAPALVLATASLVAGEWAYKKVRK